MRVRRSDCEDFEYTDELMAKNITEAVCDQFSDWLAEEVPFNLKADVYIRVRETQKEGIEI
uniref:Uncharacterized protein n=1 Tax=viral metagenome TaxID=1070528 RepID=A0A6M3JL42_9ZZZZ